MELSERKMPWWVIVLTGIIILIVSVFLLADRISGLVLLTWVVALGAAVTGIYDLFLALKDRNSSTSIPLLVHGLLDLLLVLLIIVIPDSQALLGIIIACWLMVFGVFEIISGRRSDSAKRRRLGILLIIIGLALLIVPLALCIDYVILIAIAGLVFGIYRIVLGILIKAKYDQRTSDGRSNLL